MSARASIALRSSARRIVRETCAALPPGERTVGAKLLASDFVDRCAASAAANDWPSVTAWARSACERYGDALPVERVLRGAMDRVAAAFDPHGDETAALAFERARAELGGALAPPPRRARTQRFETVDEIDVLIDTLLERLDLSDPLTAEHCRAVGAWCARLEKRLGGSHEEIAHLTRAGLIHDVGKVNTPVEILIAPRALSADEMATMRRHTLDGEAIVREIALAAHLAGAVRSHHERFDGKGYPDGLRGTAIPRDARIVAVADAFNAMIGRRPYRLPLSPSDALDQLVRNRGTQFDPDAVDAMTELVAERA
jgi:putative nucleotidyltransferase with HDIG domain